jgi:N6-L-threonylcarbamoyladenine synthase
MRILSIETSCDETAVSIIEAFGGLETPSYRILGNALYSQIDAHAIYGGVFPMLAKREHARNLIPLLGQATKLAREKLSREDTLSQVSIPEVTDQVREKIKEVLSREEGLYESTLSFFVGTSEFVDIDYIAVTEGPGLEPALWVGVSFAKALSILLQKPLVPINHMEGHIVSVLMSEGTPTGERESQSTIAPIVQFPVLALLISGGHTELVLSTSWHTYKIIGQTVDDAVGEAFDKVARLLGLPYPGGPKISKLAEESRSFKLRDAAKKNTGECPWTLPRPMIKSNDFNFSFSGLKTAVLYAVQKKLKERATSSETGKEDIVKSFTDSTQKQSIALTPVEQMTLAEEFENAVTEVLLSKTRKALEVHDVKTLIIGGGVIANVYIREALKQMILQNFPDTTLLIPSIDLTTDNSIMIGIAGYLRVIANDSRILQPKDALTLTAKGNLHL